MSSLKVAVRVRPFISREIEMDSQLVVEMDGKKTRLNKPKQYNHRDLGRENHHDFTFDYSYWSFDTADPHFVTQEEVYNDLGIDVLDCAFQGYNACIFAYGQTGSGKTFTMMGSEDNPGLIPRICQELFKRIRIGQEAGTGYKTHASYLEIYNERVRDLLDTQHNGQTLRVREHPNSGSYVENLSKHSVVNFDEIQSCIARGNLQRTTASTNMNDTSSRSHAIFTITFVQAVFMDEMPSETVSKIHLVDLAGSERANATGATGQRLKEGAHINKSLVTLGSVISALAEHSNMSQSSSSIGMKRSIYIPYRDSTLTWLLKDSLGGNSKTIMIAALSPADCNYSETLSTLRYANRAKNIINKPTINEDPNVKLIRELREEIQKLKSMITPDMMSLEPSSKVIEDLQKKEAQEKVLTEEWAEKWKEAQSILQEQKSLGLRKSGLGVVLDSEMPHLIAIHNDVTTGVTLYSLKEGETLIGNKDSNTPQDIELNGEDIFPEHCSFALKDGIVTIYPKPLAHCMVNARIVNEPTIVTQGDIILLGRTNIFRFNNPAEAAELRKDIKRPQSDMSRLSLITSSTSRENLLTSSFCVEENASSTSTLPAKKSSQVILEEENRKILDSIENSLRQLNIEREQMYKDYEKKHQLWKTDMSGIEKGSMDTLQLACYRKGELLALNDMLLWDKRNEKLQVDIICKQISTLHSELDMKKNELSNLAIKELGNLKECANLVEEIQNGQLNINSICEKIEKMSSSMDLTTVKYLDLFKNKAIVVVDLEQEVKQREEMLKKCVTNIVDMDEKILYTQDQLNKIDEDKSIAEVTDVGTCKNEASKVHSAENNVFDHELRSQQPPRCGGSLSVYEDNNMNITCDDSNVSSTICHPILSDSGIWLDSSRNHRSNHLSANVDVDNKETSVANNQEQFLTLSGLREKIAMKKIEIMQSIECEVDKYALNEHIAELQDMQRQCIALERTSMSNQDKAAETYLTDYPEKDCLDNDAQSLALSNELNGNVPSGESSTSVDCDHIVSIPCFVLRGAGKHTHYEYEIRIILEDGMFNILRRYSRFRELHLSMKHCYGTKIANLPFPRREVFSSNNETVAKHRRRSLELYLRRLIIICSKIPQCPIYKGPGGPGITRQSLVRFSPFFKKGLFENGKHGTG